MCDQTALTGCTHHALLIPHYRFLIARAGIGDSRVRTKRLGLRWADHVGEPVYEHDAEHPRPGATATHLEGAARRVCRDGLARGERCPATGETCRAADVA